MDINDLPPPPKKKSSNKKSSKPAKPKHVFGSVLLPGTTLPVPDLPPILPPKVDLGPSVRDFEDLRRVAHELALRKMQPLRLYEPLPIQAEFHDCNSKTRLLRGSNRGGKTLTCAIEFAKAVLGIGRGPKNDGRFYIVGKDEKHLGEVIYRKMFRPGAFRMIRDEVTGDWRAYRPWTDGHRRKASKPCPPLIPPREIVSISWSKKVASIPEKVTLRNGTEIDFFSSLAKPPRGSDLDGVWLDEEIVDSDWVPEMHARLLDRQGFLIWGFTPQTGSDRAFELHQRCEEQMEDWRLSGYQIEKEPAAREFVILLRDNTHFSQAEKDEYAANFSAEEQAVRIDGDFAIEAAKVYPEFAPSVHSVPYFDMPMEWTRYAVIDPGRQICAVLFAAVPPPDAEFPSGSIDDNGEPEMVKVLDRKIVILYDELYIPNCDAVLFGEKMKLKCQGQDFEAFIIDGHGSRSHEAGSGKTIEQQYTEQLRKQDIESRISGHGFIIGSDDAAGRTEAFRLWLRVQKWGRPSLHIIDVKNRLPNLKWELERWRYKRSRDGILDQPETRGRVHLMACCGYLAHYDPKYVEPVARARAKGGAYQAFMRREARRRHRQGPKAIVFGPPKR